MRALLVSKVGWIRGPEGICVSLYKEICPHNGMRALFIIKVNIHAIRTSFLQCYSQVRSSSIIDCGIKSQFLNQILGFLVGSGNAYNTTTVYLGDLSYNRSYRAGCARDNDCFILNWLSNIQQSEIGSKPGNSQHSQRCSDWSNFRIYLSYFFFANYGVILPTEISDYKIPLDKNI